MAVQSASVFTMETYGTGATIGPQTGYGNLDPVQTGNTTGYS